MATSGAIWQVQSGAINGLEATATPANTIVFDNDEVTGSGGVHYRTEILLRNSSPENTSLEGGVNDIEDMGPDGVDIQVTGEFKNSAIDVANVLKFWKEDKYTTGYPKGRFGLRLTVPDNFNVVPTATYGYHFINPKLIIDYELEKVIGFVVTLRLSGDVLNAI